MLPAKDRQEDGLCSLDFGQTGDWKEVDGKEAGKREEGGEGRKEGAP